MVKRNRKEHLLQIVFIMLFLILKSGIWSADQTPRRQQRQVVSRQQPRQLAKVASPGSQPVTETVKGVSRQVLCQALKYGRSFPVYEGVCLQMYTLHIQKTIFQCTSYVNPEAEVVKVPACSIKTPLFDCFIR